MPSQVDNRFRLQVRQFVEREPSLEEPGLRVPGVRCPEEPRLRVDQAIDYELRSLRQVETEELRDDVEVRRGLGMPDCRDADMHPLPSAQENEQVVFVEFAISVENRPGEPSGFAQGERQVVGPIDVPEKPVGTARPGIALLAAFPVQVVGEVCPEDEVTQVGFPLGLSLCVALGVGGERGSPIDEPSPPGLMPDDAESRRVEESCCLHSVLSPRGPVEAGGVYGRAVAPVVGRRERLGLGRLDADDIEPTDSVVFRPVVVLSECHLRVDDDAFGKGSLQLLQARDAELAEIALRHRQRGLR